MKRNATAIWIGSGKEGHGNLSTETGILNNAQYSYKGRFENGTGTNPEELIGAAHAGCFSMKLSFLLGEKGFTPDEINTKATITLENGAITNSHLEVKAKVNGLAADQFKAIAEDAKANCIVSKLLNTNITMTAELIA